MAFFLITRVLDVHLVCDRCGNDEWYRHVLTSCPTLDAADDGWTFPGGISCICPHCNDNGEAAR
jgi:hypothetical protein